jgi:ATPase family associated with various cellular activities (AAA)/Winged helix domain, variant
VTERDWHSANQRYLTAALAVVRAAIEGEGREEAEELLRAAAAELDSPSALDILCSGFGLTPFERDVLLLCAAPEFDAAFAVNGPPTFGLALATLPNAHWTALAPSGPLRRWRLVELGSAATLAASPLRIDERVLHYLAGVSSPDERLRDLLAPVAVPDQLSASQRSAAERLASLLASAPASVVPPVVHLGGRDRSAARAIAAAACARLGAGTWTLAGGDVPLASAERDALARLWERETVLQAAVLLVECTELDEPEAMRTVAAFVEAVEAAVLVSGDGVLRTRRRPLVRLDVRRPSTTERRDLWATALGPAAAELDGVVDALAAHFDLGAEEINTAVAAVAGSERGSLGHGLWEACRVQSRPGLEALAQRIEPVATWDDLVVPERELETLREIAAHVRRRKTVYDDWGWGRQSARGLGISVLFAGASGTGKTMAGEVLANELALDLYRIDLSQVVSKYIGETEKNLRRVFDAAESGGAILLFDEADALFGKRTEVRDSHDRYANIEVSYLLQRMEGYRGLAILTTNMRESIDSAFLRRLRFVVVFPFPDATHRAEIWRHIFPAEMPTAELGIDELAQLSLAGGSIRSIAINAAFLAADGGEPLRMEHLARAARTEYAKLERPLVEAEVGAWS